MGAQHNFEKVLLSEIAYMYKTNFTLCYFNLTQISSFFLL